jgi:nitrous oxide reductase accessory protein NosL
MHTAVTALTAVALLVLTAGCGAADREPAAAAPHRIEDGQRAARDGPQGAH